MTLLMMAGAAMAVLGGDVMRIVPLVKWPREGVVSPDGTLWAAWSSKRVFLIDAKEHVLMRNDVLDGAQNAAFSPDCAFMAACGLRAGFLLDLRSGTIATHENLRGQLVAFTPDSKSILTIRLRPNVDHEAGRGIGIGRVGGAYEVQILDLKLEPKKSYPIGMPYLSSLTFSPDGATLLIKGYHGSPMNHVPRVGTADEMVDLKTGEAKLTLGPIERGFQDGFQRREANALSDFDPKTLMGQDVQSFFWDEVSGLCTLYGAGMPEGGVVKVWDVRGATYAHTLGKSNAFIPMGFHGTARMLGAAWINEVKTLAHSDARSGTLSALNYFSEHALPSPDGAHVATSSALNRPDGQGERVEIRDANGVVLFAQEDLTRWTRGTWSPKGRYFLQLAGDRMSLRCIDTRDKSTLVFKLADFITPPRGPDTALMLWSFAVDTDEELLALGAGGSNSGGATIVRLSDRSVVARVDGFSGWVQAIQFISADEVLLGSRNGKVILHSLKKHEKVWTRETGIELTQFGFVRGSAVVVCQDTFGGANILQLSDGNSVRRVPRVTSSGSSDGTAWTHPQLIGDGEFALEVDFDTFVLRLVRTRTGETVRTYCALPQDQWIVYAPDGSWNGSERVGEFVRFYEGMRRLSDTEAAKKKSALTER